MKTAIVTGASRGIGAATARLLAHNGYAVAVNYCDSKKKADTLVSAIIKDGGKAIAVEADMGSESGILNLFKLVDKELGNIAALVNNAAVNPSGLVQDTDYATLEKVFRVNVFGVVTACREAMQYMKKQGGGAIVNISSEAARFGGNRMAHYAASKAAVNTFTVGFAREVAGDNIRVNVVSPGIIDTDANTGITADKLASLPMKRMGKAEEVAETIAWLLSDKASYVSGAVLTVAGAR